MHIRVHQFSAGQLFTRCGGVHWSDGESAWKRVYAHGTIQLYGITSGRKHAVRRCSRYAVTHARPASADVPLVDPMSKYPKPPYPGQSQPWPGLASKMTPRPDHGETSYKGSGRLTGRKALITGGDSGMGRAAAIAYAREGADVAISYYPTEEPDAREVVQLIKAEGRKAVPIPGDLREENYCKELVARAVAELGGLDVVVSNAGRQQQCEDILQ